MQQRALATLNVKFDVIKFIRPRWPTMPPGHFGLGASAHRRAGAPPRANSESRMPNDHAAAEYRDRAEECRQQAERSISPLDKAHWLKIAEEWLKLAQEVEQVQTKRR